MRFAKWVFTIAAIYGILVMTPQYFLEQRVGQDFPPPITHPEYFYGFAGVTLAWQIMFLVIARDPVRYRLAMIPAILEKASWGIAVVALYAHGRVPNPVLVFGLLDSILGILFVVAFLRTPNRPMITEAGARAA